MKLLFIASSDGYNGDNGDLFVIATEAQEAIKAWRDHYELEDGEEPDWIFEVPTGRSMVCRPVALKWHTDIKPIWGTGPSR